MNFLKESSSGTKLAFSVIITGFCFLFLSLIALLLAMPVFDLSLSELYSQLQFFSEENTDLLKFFQGFQSTGLFVLPPLLIAQLLYRNSNEVLFWQKKPSGEQLVVLLVLMISLFPVINLLASWNAQLELPAYFQALEEWMKEKEMMAEKITLAFLQVNTWQSYGLNMLIMAVIPAIGEEFLFRGVLQKQFAILFKNKHVGAILAALFFSAIHIQFYGFVPRFLLGLIFAYLLIWTGNIWLPVLAHFINNGTAVSFYYFTDVDKIEQQVETFGTDSSTLIFTLMAFVIVSWTGWWFYTKRDKSAYFIEKF